MARYSQGGYDKLVALMETLEAQLAEARLSLGGAAEADSNTWHDNAAFDEANRAIRDLENRVLSVKNRLADAVVVPGASDGTVDVGSLVTYRFVGDDEQMTVEVAGAHAVRSVDDEVAQVSTTSPLGAAIMGKVAGAVVAYRGPTGRTFKVKILMVT